MSGKPAARVSDPTACPLPGHGTNPIAAGSGDVLFDGLAAARQGDASACGGAMVGDLATTVLINGKPAVTVGSVGTHGNKVTTGSGTVIIGNSHSPALFSGIVATALDAVVAALIPEASVDDTGTASERQSRMAASEQDVKSLLWLAWIEIFAKTTNR
ncbi:PAAR domain-containing protein [Pseudomonas frederiksbergensis]|uniref:PAAR domain-containing protein n=1 Tax=Pseudomonas frederiksbergensis TaxID=104087 RepID=UPI002182096D|nr:PAAR domain-containing protein [Pseudomonas frederiksbergensis]